jgi:hypothetical protein
MAQDLPISAVQSILDCLGPAMISAYEVDWARYHERPEDVRCPKHSNGGGVLSRRVVVRRDRLPQQILRFGVPLFSIARF